MPSGGRIAIVGSGNWGTTLACMLATAGRAVTLLARSEEEAAALRSAGENTRYLPGVHFPLQLAITGDPQRAVPNAQTVLLAVPSQTMRENVARIRPFVARETAVLSCAKGLERG